VGGVLNETGSFGPGQATLDIIAFHLGGERFCIKTTSIREIRDGQRKRRCAATPRRRLSSMPPVERCTHEQHGKVVRQNKWAGLCDDVPALFLLWPIPVRRQDDLTSNDALLCWRL